MDDLTLVGVHDDGEHVLLAGSGGQRYRLRVDDALRAAVRRDRARLSQIQLEADGRLRPREIQSRIRAGETAEDVAEAAGLTLEHVRRYEGAVLAERRYVAEQARAVRIRRSSGVGPDTLEELVQERLTQREASPEDVSWDAWRAEDSSWTLVLRFTAGGRRREAQWSYDPAVRHVTVQDDEARWLTEEEPTAPAAVQRRLSPVRDRVFDVEASGETHPGEEVPNVDLLDTLRERRGRRNRPMTDEEELVAGPDPVREAIDSMLGRAEGMAEATSHPSRSRIPEPLRERESQGAREPRDGELLLLAEAEARDASARDEDEDVARRPGRKPRRASVPSWDDIVFGQRRD
jgi:hypothetical protein